MDSAALGNSLAAGNQQMDVTKSGLALLVIAAGGFINAAIGNASQSLPATAVAPVGSPFLAASALPGDAMMHLAAERALLAQVRQDLGDSEARVGLGAMHFEPSSGRTVEGRGLGTIFFDADASIPVEVTVSYDLIDNRVEQTAYLVSDSGQQAVPAAVTSGLRQRIADRIGSSLVVEFAQQSVDFSLRRIEHLAGGRNRLLISGAGIARFQGEGAALTRFVATARRDSGEILTIQYELGEEIAEPSAPATASLR